MVTLRFTTEKTNKQQFIITPSVVANYLDSTEETTIELFFGWLNRVFGISISWTSSDKSNTECD